MLSFLFLKCLMSFRTFDDSEMGINLSKENCMCGPDMKRSWLASEHSSIQGEVWQGVMRDTPYHFHLSK